MASVDPQTVEDVKTIVYDYFAEECDIDVSELSDSTNIIDDLEGDSLMLLSLLEIFRKKYGLTIELKTLGKHLMKRPANTIGEVITLSLKIVENGDDILKIDL